MAERKPLIPPTAAPTSVLARIISRDQQESGRGQAQPAPDVRTNIQEEVRPTAEKDTRAYAHITSNLENRTDGTSEAFSSDSHTEGPATRTTSATARAQLRKDIEAKAKTSLVPITLRLPTALNDWLDIYAFAHRKEGIRKQDLIAEALTLLAISKELQE